MPLVRVDYLEGRSEAYRIGLSESLHRAMVDTIGIPADDRFQILTEHTAEQLVADPHFLGIHRSSEMVFIQITLNAGRTVEIKKKLYARIVELLSKNPGIRPEDVVINLVEVTKENWSFGKGEAPYAPK